MTEASTASSKPGGVQAATILHVDMDAFFAAVEVLRRPELAGQPVVVGAAGRRGVVASASYEARFYGIRSAMPSLQARQLCPQAVFVPGDHGHYQAVWKRIEELLRSFTPLVESVSCDEAFLDVEGSRRRFGPPIEIARRIRAEVFAAESLTCSIGVASNKLLSKLASGLAKPRSGKEGPKVGEGVALIDPSRELEFIHALPVEYLWGVGASTLRQLETLRVRRVADLAALSLDELVERFGKAHGLHLHRLARAIDDTPVLPHQPPKSMSSEVTFASDIFSESDLQREILRQSEALARRLRKAGFSARVVVLKLRHPDFRTLTRSRRLKNPSNHRKTLADALKELLSEYMSEQKSNFSGFRLLGVGASGLSIDTPTQLTLGAPELASETLDKALDRIHSRYGEGVVVPAALREPTAPTAGEPGHWGPNSG